MKREDKQKLFAGLILLMFIGSSIAIAFQSGASILGGEEAKQEPQQLLYNIPLSSAQESVFITQNYVIVKYFYNANCITCDAVSRSIDKIFTDLNQKIVIERIDTEVYHDEVKAANVTSVPYFYLKGRIIDKFEYKSSNDLFVRICDTYIQTIQECQYR